MKTYLDCIPCFFKQALEAARLAGADVKTQKRILEDVAKTIPKFSLDSSPPEMARIIHRLVKKAAGRDDPYINIKRKSNALALRAYPALKRKVERSPDGLATALRLAIAGNIIDYGVKNSLNVEKEVRRILLGKTTEGVSGKRKYYRDSDFRRVLRGAKTLLYLADNAGEVVFDRVLIEEIKKRDSGKRVVYAVKEKPAINDALIHDARECGIEETAEVMSSGSDAPGKIPHLCSREFMDLFRKADMVISKGQGNFESLSGTRRPIFFLFMAKCPVVAGEIGCGIGETVLLYRTRAGK